jgi:hypothetical protein
MSPVDYCSIGYIVVASLFLIVTSDWFRDKFNWRL